MPTCVRRACGPTRTVADQGVDTELGGLPACHRPIKFTIVVSEPYTSRLATLDSVRGTLIFAGRHRARRVDGRLARWSRGA